MRIERLFDFRHVPAIHVFEAPLGNHRRGNFGMKLQSIGGAAESKCLVLGSIGRRKEIGALREIEGLGMPMEEAFAAVEGA